MAANYHIIRSFSLTISFVFNVRSEIRQVKEKLSNLEEVLWQSSLGYCFQKLFQQKKETSIEKEIKTPVVEWMELFSFFPLFISFELVFCDLLDFKTMSTAIKKNKVLIEHSPILFN